MSDIIVSEYIYLLQLREFLNTKEDIFKVGMTTKLNHIRFNQYPKGSKLLFQMICKNCKNMEKQIKKSLIETFKQRKDIGTEYFEGNYKKIPIETHIKYCSTLGFKNIIVLKQDKTNNMYNIVNFRKYLQDNKEIILNCINKEEKRCEPDRFKNMYDDDIFYLTYMLLPNYLKWCCIR